MLSWSPNFTEFFHKSPRFSTKSVYFLFFIENISSTIFFSTVKIIFNDMLKLNEIPVNLLISLATREPKCAFVLIPVPTAVPPKAAREGKRGPF